MVGDLNVRFWVVSFWATNYAKRTLRRAIPVGSVRPDCGKPKPRPNPQKAIVRYDLDRFATDMHQNRAGLRFDQRGGCGSLAAGLLLYEKWDKPTFRFW